MIRRFANPAPLTVVRGPHGFGKSMITAQWLRSLGEDVDVLWFGFDWGQALQDITADDFWSLLAERLEEFSPTVRRPGGSEPLEGLDRVRQHFAERTKPIYVVLDRYSETIPSELGIDHVLTDLVRGAEMLFLVVCARDITTIEVVGSVMVDSLVLRPADLVLTVDDVLELAAQQSITLTREEAIVLCEETGGWPALVRVILTGSAADRQSGDTFALNLDAGRWFLRSVWSEFSDPRISDFVVRTGFVGDFTQEVAQSLCGETNVLPEIEALVSASLLRVHHTPEGTVYSHLPAVRREVRQRLRTEDRVQYRELSSFAAALLQERGQIEAALNFLVRAKLWDALLDLVEQSWTTLIEHHPSELARLLEELPPGVVMSSPYLVAAQVHLSSAELGHGSRIGLLGTSSDPRGSALGASLSLRGHSGDAIDGTTSVVSQYASVSPEIQSRLSMVLYEWAVAKLMSVSPYDALSYFEEASALAVAFDVPDMVERCAIGAALVNVLLGEVNQAAAWLPSADDPPPADQEEDGPSALSGPDGGRAADSRKTGVAPWEPDHDHARTQVDALKMIVQGYVAVGRLAAPDVLEEISHLPSHTEFEDLWALGVVARAQVAILQGNQFAVLEEIEQSDHVLSARADNDLLRAMVISAKVELLLSLGQLFRARAALTAASHGETVLVVAAARAAFMSGDYAKSSTMASESIRSGLRSPRMKMGVLLVLAASEHARGRRTEAIQAIREALTISRDSGLTIYFAFMRSDVLADLSTEVPGLVEIMETVAQVVDGEAFPAPSIVEELSEREREVLVALSKAKSLGGVAKALYLTTNTVKTHLRSIYRKLDTHSAGETIQRAIECGLIEAPESR